MVILLGSGWLLELLIRPLWKIRYTLAFLASGISTFAATGIFILKPSLATGLLIGLLLYRITSMIRLLFSRLHIQHLKKATWRTSLYVGVAQGLLLTSEHFIQTLKLSADTLWTLAGILCLTGSVLLVWSSTRSIVKTRFKDDRDIITDANLPSITIALPARNETGELETALSAIVQSDYPKFEVIVLDDCSQNKRTPEIIRNFAQQGVRFLAGIPPKDGWLAKNQAYQQLLDSASGTYIVFLGVDIEIERATIRKVVTTLLARDKKMMSIMPLRSWRASGHFSLTQAYRYFWELAPPRRLFKRPPVLSSCWIIERAEIVKLGGFKAVSNMIMPEAYFARHTSREHDGYSFLRSDGALGLLSSKSVAAQWRTGVRSRYSQVHRRLEFVALLSYIELATLALPYAALILALIIHLPLAAVVLFSMSTILLSFVSIQIAYHTKVNPTLFAVLSLPLQVFNDILLLHYSAYKHEFSAVEWKGRNICIPMMQVIPSLPKFKDRN